MLSVSYPKFPQKSENVPGSRPSLPQVQRIEYSREAGKAAWAIFSASLYCAGYVYRLPSSVGGTSPENTRRRALMISPSLMDAPNGNDTDRPLRVSVTRNT